MTNLKLRVGGIYKSRDGCTWVCFRVRTGAEVFAHAIADCVRQHDQRIEYFFADGRYDRGGKREHTLISEVTT